MISSKKTVLITGCSVGGMGHALALAFEATGQFHVFATARQISKMSALAGKPDITLLPLDVTDTASVTAAAEVVRDYHTRNGSTPKLDVLVNNAGIAHASPLLDHDMKDARELFEANFWGCVNMVNAFSDMVIEAKGVVVNNCSLNVHVNPVWMGMFDVFSSLVVVAGICDGTWGH